MKVLVELLRVAVKIQNSENWNFIITTKDLIQTVPYSDKNWGTRGYTNLLTQLQDCKYKGDGYHPKTMPKRKFKEMVNAES